MRGAKLQSPSDHLRQSLSLLPFWVRLSTAVHVRLPQVPMFAVALIFLVMLCHFFCEPGFFSLETSMSVGVACAGPFRAFSYIFRGIRCMAAAADAEAKFHVAISGGHLVTSCAIYFLFVKSLIGERMGNGSRQKWQ